VLQQLLLTTEAVAGGQPNPNNVRGKNLSGPGGLARVSGAALPIPPLHTAAVGNSSVAAVSAAAAAAGGSLSPRSEHAVMQAAASLAPAVQQRLIESVARRSDTKIELKRYFMSEQVAFCSVACTVDAPLCSVCDCVSV
jgi:hypothetical protein